MRTEPRKARSAFRQKRPYSKREKIASVKSLKDLGCELFTIFYKLE